LDKITPALSRLFEGFRIVFWYDEKSELRREFETLLIPGVETIELVNNEFAVKHRILREQPAQKFLIYHEGPQPGDLENWLLDVQLAQGTFSADQVSLWMTELGLRPEFWDFLQEHSEFFKAESRRDELRVRLSAEDNHNAIRTKMLAVCANGDTEPRIENILEVLLLELAEDRDDKINLIRRCSLETFLWNRLEVHFGYKSQTPSIKDFAIGLFQACYAISLEEETILTQDALVFLKRWKDSIRFQKAFETLSEEYADLLGIEKDLQNRDVRALIDIDFFKLIDQRILGDLVQEVVQRTISAGECANLIWRRRSTHWFDEYSNIYEAVYFASQFVSELDQADLRMESLADGIRKYQKTWYRLDQYYRKFIYHVRTSKQTNLLQRLIDQVENLYSNNFLLPVNDNWQHIIDSNQAWDAVPFLRQDSFFDRYIREYMKTKNKVAVIISDAFRYEVGEELARNIEAEDRFTAELEAMLSMLPSYTQLGMAALLPHGELTIAEDGTALIDGQSTAGKDNRTKILSAAVEEGATAIRSADLLNMSKEESREFAKQNQVIYIYHNQIDAVGDKMETEDRVFDAVESGLGELVDILKKLTNANLTNILITSDHGFIYQNRPLQESEFASEDVGGEDISVRNRRFILGKHLAAGNSLKEFKPADLGLTGDFQILIPKSINRLRLQGSGSRYVHGGASLQEVVIPIIKINKKRSSDLTQVEVDIITSSSLIITTGQLSVAFYQTEPISAKVQSRCLRAGIYSQDGTLISDPHELNFDLTSPDPREREVRIRFVMSRKADDVNNQTVYLKLEEPISGTSHTKEYRILPYQLRRSFTTDFD
jgi:uncharacterized protein (TIGR02687 family)